MNNNNEIIVKEMRNEDEKMASHWVDTVNQRCSSKIYLFTHVADSLRVGVVPFQPLHYFLEVLKVRADRRIVHPWHQAPFQKPGLLRQT